MSLIFSSDGGNDFIFFFKCCKVYYCKEGIQICTLWSLTQPMFLYFFLLQYFCIQRFLNPDSPSSLSNSVSLPSGMFAASHGCFFFSCLVKTVKACCLFESAIGKVQLLIHYLHFNLYPGSNQYILH